MPTCRRTAVIDADFGTVWDFYDSVEELEPLTPDWMGLHVRRVIGPDERPDPAGYLEGTKVHLEWGPLGPVADAEWFVEITEREEEDGRARFVDEQIGDRGPYAEWCHTHRFADLGDAAMIHDRIDYRVPGPATCRWRPRSSPGCSGPANARALLE